MKLNLCCVLVNTRLVLQMNEEHLTHVLHQLQNKPGCIVCCLFILLISLGVLGIQQVARQVGPVFLE
jgi:hypothetical protein